MKIRVYIVYLQLTTDTTRDGTTEIQNKVYNTYAIPLSINIYYTYIMYTFVHPLYYNEEQLKPWITGNSLLNASATCGNFNFKSCISNGSATVSNRSLV